MPAAAAVSSDELGVATPELAVAAPAVATPAVLLARLLVPDKALSAGYLTAMIARTWLPAGPAK